MSGLSIRAALATLLIVAFAGTATAQSCDKPKPPDKPTSALPAPDAAPTA